MEYWHERSNVNLKIYAELALKVRMPILQIILAELMECSTQAPMARPPRALQKAIHAFSWHLNNTLIERRLPLIL